MMIIDEKAVYKVKDLKPLASQITVLDWINTGKLKAVKRGRDWFISGKSLLKFLEGNDPSKPNKKKR